MKRVVVTGLGWLTPMAADRESTWEAMLAGRDGLGPLSYPGWPGPVLSVAALKGFRMETGQGNFCEQVALRGAAAALAHFPLDGDPQRRGVFQAASTSGLPAGEAYLRDQGAGSFGHPARVLDETPNRVTDRLAALFQAQGPRSTVMNACSSSLTALAQAWYRLASGELDAALAGGVEGLCLTTLAGFSSLRAIDPEPCRPFSADRAGLNLGEGTAQFLLESLEHAQRRGAPILGEVLGFGAALDAHHATAPHPEGAGAARAIALALQTARLNAEAIDLVSAHGTATPANDGAECRALRTALGGAAERLNVTSTKSQFGHTLAAAGAFGAAAALLALRDQVVSPTLRLESSDPACDLDCTPRQAKHRPLRHALVNAFAFGGNNVCLALKRWEGA